MLSAETHIGSRNSQVLFFFFLLLSIIIILYTFHNVFDIYSDLLTVQNLLKIKQMFPAGVSKAAGLVAQNVDPDQTPYSVSSDLCMNCSQ